MPTGPGPAEKGDVSPSRAQATVRSRTSASRHPVAPAAGVPARPFAARDTTPRDTSPRDVDALVTEHLPLAAFAVNAVASRISLPAHVSREDLLSCARVALVEVARRFDPSAGASFATYALARLQGAVLDELRSGDWASRSECIAHLDASWPEYNRFYAHPFTWSWTRARMHSWVDRHLS